MGAGRAAASAAILVAIGSCGADETTLRIDYCDQRVLRLLVFDELAACETEDPRHGDGHLQSLLAADWMDPSTSPAPRLAVGDAAVAVVAQCRDLAGVIHSWGCDDDDDGGLRIHLEDVCLALCAEGCPRGSTVWNDGGFDACVPECEGCEPCGGGACACSAGRCVDPGMDGDGDGIPVAEDCDDDDATIGSHDEAPCRGECSDGLQTCDGGRWGECVVPGGCDCDPGATVRRSCGKCGTQEVTCGIDGRWEDPGPCESEGECAPGEVGEPVACPEDCGQRTATCNDACVWVPGGCDRTLCDATCADLFTDWTRCGACDLSCASRVCEGGECTCPAGASECVVPLLWGGRQLACGRSCAPCPEECADGEVCCSDTCCVEANCSNGTCSP